MVAQPTTPPLASEDEAMDAYSTVVSGVAERLVPSVASLRIEPRGSRGRATPGGAGSAVVLSPDGYLLTSAHVVARAGAGTATFADGRELEFEVRGRDPLSDLAVVRAPASDLRAAAFGDAERLRIGQLVVAVGSPMGLAGSLTAGVVSALGRSFPTRTGSATRIVENVIQTDAALNPGNSGGALGDSQARVVGINTAVAGVGVGLAVPINATTQRIIAALLAEGRYRRAFLGIAGGARPLPPRAARLLGRRRSVEISDVVPGSPAALAGLAARDIIVALDGAPVEDAGDLQRLMVGESIGRPLTLTIVRGGRLVDLSVTPVELPPD
jgi:S1-C subfamily serine protease